MKLSRLKLLRLERGLRQDEVAQAVGISRSYLSGLENLAMPMTTEILARLAQYYQVSPSELN